MSTRIEDYALIGDSRTAALVGRDGSIDWLCLPRFDSPSAFGALLGDDSHGRWALAPEDREAARSSRAYLEDTFVLVTHWETPAGEVEVLDYMPLDAPTPTVVRRIRGLRGTVRMRHDLRIRFDYAAALPWMRQLGSEGEPVLLAVAGPDAAVVRGVALEPSDHAHGAVVQVSAGEVTEASLTWFPSHREVPAPLHEEHRLAQTIQGWRRWAATCVTHGAHDEHVRRSLLTLRALTHKDTGGIVAAATTSLPEDFGGVRNWDYRYVWLRDAALTIIALVQHGYAAEAARWRNWLLRAIAGDPADVQIMYGLAGERRLTELELGSLPGYEGSAPVRIGNGAYTQYQGDVFGEVMVALEEARNAGVEEDQFSWPLQLSLLGRLEEVWDRPDSGIWEIRGPDRRFTHSRAMIWAAFDRGVRAIERFGLPGPVQRWRELRDRIRAEIETRGYNAQLGSFVQHYDTTEVDASLLQLSAVGFVAADDPRMLGTVARIEETLMRDGFLLRYRTQSGVDGLPGDESPFLACSFWLVHQYADSGRLRDAEELLTRLVALSNDVGLFSEEYDVRDRRQAGNFPQALTHLAFVRAAQAVSEARAREASAPAAAEAARADAAAAAPAEAPDSTLAPAEARAAEAGHGQAGQAPDSADVSADAR